jgi:hypothetical protein
MTSKQLSEALQKLFIRLHDFSAKAEPFLSDTEIQFLRGIEFLKNPFKLFFSFYTL